MLGFELRISCVGSDRLPTGPRPRPQLRLVWPPERWDWGLSTSEARFHRKLRFRFASSGSNKMKLEARKKQELTPPGLKFDEKLHLSLIRGADVGRRRHFEVCKQTKKKENSEKLVKVCFPIYLGAYLIKFYGSVYYSTWFVASLFL